MAKHPSKETRKISKLERELASYKDREELINKFFSLDLYKLGQGFFDKAVQLLSQLIGADYAFIGRLDDEGTINTISFFACGKIAANFSYKLEGSPCASVIEKGACVYPSGVAELFPEDKPLREMEIESYIGVLLRTTTRAPIGILTILSKQPFKNTELAESFLLMFAGRASAEMEHYEYRARLQAQNLDLQRQREELIEARKKAEESDRLKTAFLANMSHEIRTPMNAIIGFSSLLRDTETTPEEHDEYLEYIQSRGGDLLGLVDNVIDLSRIEADAVELDLSECQLEELLRQTREQFERLAQKSGKDITIALQIDPELPSTLHTDKGRLNQCLTNLIGNALKFTEKGIIKIECCKETDTIRFNIHDTGPGISPDFSEKVFERFTQVDSSTTRKHGGSGLGLAITKRLVELMGGEISLREPTKDQIGSVFTFTLPQREKNKTETEKPSANNNVKEARPLKLLVVEDDEFNRMVLTKLLQAEGATVTCVDNPSDAIVFCKNTPDLDAVFMDVHMPEGCGLNCTQELKQIRPDLPIVIQSASVFDRDKENARKAGADGFLAKPMSRDTLQSCLDDLRAVRTQTKKPQANS